MEWQLKYQHEDRVRLGALRLKVPWSAQVSWKVEGGGFSWVGGRV